MSRLFVAFLVAVAFASGVASGVVIKGASQPSMPRGRVQVVEDIDRHVRPSGDQLKKIDAIIERNQPRFAQVKTELAEIRSDVRAQIRAVLDPEAKVRFDEWCTRRDEQRAARDQ